MPTVGTVRPDQRPAQVVPELGPHAPGSRVEAPLAGRKVTGAPECPGDGVGPHLAPTRARRTASEFVVVRIAGTMNRRPSQTPRSR